MKPNLFSIATKELSQDAFIAWLIQWADDSCSDDNPALCEAGKRFVKKLISLQYADVEIDVKNAWADRQWENIDILAEVNNEYVLIIEDKINTDEHDNQLERYKEIVEASYGKGIKPVYIYFKTGLETMDNIRNIKEKGWAYFSRKDFLEFLQGQNPKNDIYKDYLSNLLEMQKESEKFVEYDKLNSWEATKGLYSYIENRLNEYAHWDYVPNPGGGFLGMWFHFIQCRERENCELYLQIENACNDRVNLFVKITGEWERNLEVLYGVLELLEEKSSDYNICISKPAKYRIGEYTSVASINEVFVKKENGELDLDNLIAKLEKAAKLIDCVADLL